MWVGESAAAVRIRIDLSYDGTGFSGWAAQPGRRTVEGVLAETLGHVLRLPASPRLTVAGRTDTGVHARGQVAPSDLPDADWAAYADAARGRLARALPPDIRVRAIGPAPDGFDARFSALWRRYSYRVCDDPATADPLRRHETLWHPRGLDLAAMNAAAGTLTGEHDFAAFCRRREGATTVRALRRLDWRRDDVGVAVARVVAPSRRRQKAAKSCSPVSVPAAAFIAARSSPRGCHSVSCLRSGSAVAGSSQTRYE